MLSSLKRGLLALGVATTVVAVGAATASAATTWTVTAGTTASGSTTFTASTTGTSPQIHFSDLVTGGALTCASGTAKGTVPHLGSGLSNPLANITGSTWATCTGPFGLNLAVSQPTTSVWTLNGDSYNATTGVTSGHISNVTANVTSIPAGSCSFTVSGAVTGTYTNSTHVLAVANSGTTYALTISAVSGCFGVVGNGHAASFTANYNVTTPLGALTVTSP